MEMGNLVNISQSSGFTTIHEDIDFFENNKGDIIVSNPPFSKVKEVLTRVEEVG
jgi:methylase of polypeptide subunit release factors